MEWPTMHVSATICSLDGNYFLLIIYFCALYIYSVPETYQHTTFTERGYNRRPTFFGCDKDVPLVVYLPNHLVTKETDQSTMQAVYKVSAM
jgi:hypothetical protein